MKRNHASWLVIVLCAVASSLAPAAEPTAEPAQGMNDADRLLGSDEAPDLFLLYTGDAIGYLRDCGCKRNPAGGVDRRAWVVRELAAKYPSSPMLLLDSGNFSDNPTTQGEVKTRALLEAMERMGYRVVNVGERDIRMGYDDFRSKVEGRSMLFISANLVSQESGEPVFPPHAVLEVPRAEGEPLRVGVIGVVRYNQIFLKPGPGGDNLVIAHPRERVAREIEALRAKRVDLVVVLSAMPKPDAERLAEEVQGIDYILGAYGGLFNVRAERRGETSILYVGNRGQRISESRIVFTDGERPAVAADRHRMHFLTRQYPADEAMLGFVEQVEQRIAGASSAGAPASAAR